MAEINHLIGIKGSRDDVYAAISTFEGLKTWWTADTNGASEVGETIQFRHGKPKGPDMKVTELRKNAVVKWTCIADWRMGRNGIHFRAQGREWASQSAFHAGQMEGSHGHARVLQHEVGDLFGRVERIHRDRER